MGFDIKYLRCKAPHTKVVAIGLYSGLEDNFNPLSILMPKLAADNYKFMEIGRSLYVKCGKISKSYFLLNDIYTIGLCSDHSPHIKKIIKFFNKPWSDVTKIIQINQEEAIKFKSEWVRSTLKKKLLSIMKDKYNMDIKLDQWIKLLIEAHNEECVRQIMKL